MVLLKQIISCCTGRDELSCWLKLLCFQSWFCQIHVAFTWDTFINFLIWWTCECEFIWCLCCLDSLMSSILLLNCYSILHWQHSLTVFSLLSTIWGIVRQYPSHRLLLIVYAVHWKQSYNLHVHSTGKETGLYR